MVVCVTIARTVGRVFVWSPVIFVAERSEVKGKCLLSVGWLVCRVVVHVVVTIWRRISSAGPSPRNLPFHPSHQWFMRYFPPPTVANQRNASCTSSISQNLLIISSPSSPHSSAHLPPSSHHSFTHLIHFLPFFSMQSTPGIIVDRSNVILVLLCPTSFLSLIFPFRADNRLISIHCVIPFLLPLNSTDCMHESVLTIFSTVLQLIETHARNSSPLGVGFSAVVFTIHVLHSVMIIVAVSICASSSAPFVFTHLLHSVMSIVRRSNLPLLFSAVRLTIHVLHSVMIIVAVPICASSSSPSPSPQYSPILSSHFLVLSCRASVCLWTIARLQPKVPSTLPRSYSCHLLPSNKTCLSGVYSFFRFCSVSCITCGCLGCHPNDGGADSSNRKKASGEKE